MAKAASTPPPRTRKPRRDALENHQRILASARALFQERGLVVGLHEVARHAGLGAGTVYRHFPSRAALIDALYDESLEQMRAVARAAASVRDSWHAVAQLIERSHEIRARDRGLWAIAMGSTPRAIGTGNSSYREVIPEILARAKGAGRLREDFSAADINVLNVMIAACADFTHEIDPELWRRYMGILLDGLRAQRRSTTPLWGRSPTLEEVSAAMRTWYDTEGRWGPEHRSVAGSRKKGATVRPEKT